MIIIYVVLTLLILSILIITHEFGHFAAARHFGVKVKEFAVGMGPQIISYQGGETLFSIRLFPIGGFCSLQEEREEQKEYIPLLDGETAEITIAKEEIDPEKSFYHKPAWQRFIVLAAGAAMNFITGLIIIFIAYLIAGRDPLTAFVNSFNVFGQIFGLIFQSLAMLFNGQAGVNDLAGPVGMVSMVGNFYNQGTVYLLLFAAMLSINLGIINLLPIPALDGGQMALILVEGLKRGEISKRLKENLIIISYVALLCLGLYVAYNDILRLPF